MACAMAPLNSSNYLRIKMNTCIDAPAFYCKQLSCALRYLSIQVVLLLRNCSYNHLKLFRKRLVLLVI